MLKTIDLKLFYLFNKYFANPITDFTMPLVTALGDGSILFLIALILILFGSGRAKKAGLFILAGLTITYYCVSFLKGFFMRPRPFVELKDVRLLIEESGFSFPSGHSMRAAMAASVLSGIFRCRVLFFSISALVIISRLYLGVHYPSDVLAGALIGFTIGYGIISIAKRTGSA